MITSRVRCILRHPCTDYVPFRYAFHMNLLCDFRRSRLCLSHKANSTKSLERLVSSGIAFTSTFALTLINPSPPLNAKVIERQRERTQKHAIKPISSTRRVESHITGPLKNDRQTLISLGIWVCFFASPCSILHFQGPNDHPTRGCIRCTMAFPFRGYQDNSIKES